MINDFFDNVIQNIVDGSKSSGGALDIVIQVKSGSQNISWLVLSDNIEIACGNNQSIIVKEIQRQGKRPQNIGEFILGSQIKKGSKI